MVRRSSRLLVASLIALVLGSLLPPASSGFAAASATFALAPSTAAATCLPTATGAVTITSLGAIDVMDITVDRLPPGTEFDFFVTQLPNAPFGVSWYQGDIITDAAGSGTQRFIGRFNVETFAVAPGAGQAPIVHPDPPFPDAASNPAFNPIHMFHLGLWFGKPEDALKAGCPGTVTPFNGDHAAGIQALSTRAFPDDAGPLRQIDAATTGATQPPGLGALVSTFSFDMVRSSTVVAANCLPNALGHVKIDAFEAAEIMEVSVTGLPPSTEFDFFITQVPNAPFGESWYQGEIITDANGKGSQRFVGVFSPETFFVAPGAGAAPVIHAGGPFPDEARSPAFNPVHTFHVGFWFGDPAAARAAGCPATVTPFNGDHDAGIQALSSRNFPDLQGPLSFPVFPDATDIVDPNNSGKEDEARKPTEDEKRNHQRTNRLGRDGFETQGNVLEVRCDASPPEIEIANRDGRVVVRVLAKPGEFQCSSVQVGDYLMVDFGEKQHEQLYDAYDLSVEHHK